MNEIIIFFFITKCEIMSDLKTAILDYLKSKPEISVKDLLNEVKSIVKSYKEQLKKEKKESDVKTGVAKPLNPYQLFVKEKMRTFKDNGTTLNYRERMTEISTLWKLKKELASESDGVADSDDEPPLTTPPQSPTHSPCAKDVVEPSKVKDNKKPKENKKGKSEKGSKK